MHLTRRTVARLAAGISVASTLAVGMAQGVGASTSSLGEGHPQPTPMKSTCTDLKGEYDLWVNAYLTTQNANWKEFAKDNWIADFKAGKKLGCAWATGVPTT